MHRNISPRTNQATQQISTDSAFTPCTLCAPWCNSFYEVDIKPPAPSVPVPARTLNPLQPLGA